MWFKFPLKLLFTWFSFHLLELVAVKQGMSVQEHVGNEKSCVWHARDFADGELKDELFCIRLLQLKVSMHAAFSLTCLVSVHSL